LFRSDARFAVGVIDSPDSPSKPRANESGSNVEGNAIGRASARPWQPRRHRNRPLDRWLCVPAFRRVCPCHYAPSVEVREGRVKTRKCGAALKLVRGTNSMNGHGSAYVASRARYVMKMAPR